MLPNIPRLMTAYMNTWTPTSVTSRAVNLDVVRGAKVTLGVDPLGSAGVHDGGMIAERYKLPLTVVSNAVDPTFRFMTIDCRDHLHRIQAEAKTPIQKAVQAVATG
jgi:phosphoglucomutase